MTTRKQGATRKPLKPKDQKSNQMSREEFIKKAKRKKVPEEVFEDIKNEIQKNQQLAQTFNNSRNMLVQSNEALNNLTKTVKVFMGIEKEAITDFDLETGEIMFY